MKSIDDLEKKAMTAVLYWSGGQYSSQELAKVAMRLALEYRLAVMGAKAAEYRDQYRTDKYAGLR